MKKCLIMLIVFIVYQGVYTQKIPFKIINGDIEWQETYEEDLKIKPQTIYFTEPKKKGGQYINKCFKADLFVYKKKWNNKLKGKKLHVFNTTSISRRRESIKYCFK